MKTVPVRLRDRVTVGLGSVIGIGVTVGSDVQIGALSPVPKHAMLEGGWVYVGVPVRPLRFGRLAVDTRPRSTG